MIRGAAVLVLAACGDGGSNVIPVGAQLGPALIAALAAADQVRAPWRCGAVDGPTQAEEQLTIGAHTWKLAGHTLRRRGKGEIVIGAIADAGGTAPATVASLGGLRAKLARADLIITLGGMGSTQAELEATLGALADRPGVPVLAMPGDLESARAQTAAIAAMRGRGQLVIDGRLIQQVELPGITIGIVAGASHRGRLVAGDEGCAYAAADVTRVLAELTTRPAVRVLATSEAPRVIADGEAHGELALTAGAGQELDIALHGPAGAGASRARTGRRNGAAVALTPGTADATARLPGPVRAPTAGLLTVRGETWSWRPIPDAR